MKRNIFKLFLNKFMAYPLWVKQVVYYRLWQNMKENTCDRYIIKYPEKILAIHIPTLTFQGKQELWDKAGGLDNNIYNFLKFSHNGYTVLEISLNMFLSLEEISKLYIFCMEQNLIEAPKEPEILSMAEFIAGKIRTGEYFLQNDAIDIGQLDVALAEQRRQADRGEHVLIGKILVNMGFLTEKSVKTLFRLKADAKKRFVINPELLPDSNATIKNVDKLEEEIKQLKKENQALKETMSTIVNAVKSYDI